MSETEEYDLWLAGHAKLVAKSMSDKYIERIWIEGQKLAYTVRNRNEKDDDEFGSPMKLVACDRDVPVVTVSVFCKYLYPYEAKEKMSQWGYTAEQIDNVIAEITDYEN